MSVRLPEALRREFLAALQVLRPGSVTEELTEEVCLGLLRDRTGPLGRRKLSTGNTGRPRTAGAERDVGVDAVGVSENEWALMERARALEDELRLALCSAEDIRALKVKANHLLEEVRKGKEAEIAHISRHKNLVHKNKMLSDHMESLMKIIRLLSIEKTRQCDARKEERLLVFRLTHELAVKDKKLEACKKLNSELRSSGLLLMNQMEVMERKFHDLRGRLDATRAQQNGAVDKALKEASSLRKKFAAMTRGKGLLDDVALPPESLTIHAPNSITILQQGELVMDNSISNFKTPNRNQQASNGPATEFRNGKESETERQRPSTTGGIREKKRPATAGKSRHASTPARVTGETDVDFLIEKIYAKQRDKHDNKWTPDKLRSLVVDASGNVGCKIPDITAARPGSSSGRSEPQYTKILSM